MKRSSILLGALLLVVMMGIIVGAAVANRRSFSTNQPPITNTDQSSTTPRHLAVDLSGDDDGRKLEMQVGDTLTITADNGATALGIQSGYDQNVVVEIGGGQATQFSREIQALRTGQTTLRVILTAQCSLPDQNPRCLIASRQLNLLIVVK